jgi:hypothetical protein
MTPKIQKLWHRLEAQRLDLMQLMAQHDNLILNKKPSPEAWSTLQVIHHLMDAEQASLAYMKKKLSFTSTIPKAGLKSRWRRFLLRIAFAIPIKIKAPTNLEHFPEQSNFADLSNQWASQRLELQSFIEKLPDNVVHGEIWRHQVAGKMSIAHMLDFFYAHVDRHEAQVKRTVAAVGSRQ